jgi:hypothetical protein
MKPTLLIIVATLYATVAFGQESYQAVQNLTLYNSPNRNSLSFTKMNTGDRLVLREKTGEFWSVTFMERTRYLRENDFKYIVQVDSNYANVPGSEIRPTVSYPKIKSGGDELYSAGKFLLTGSLVGIGGGAVSYLALRGGKPTLGLVCGIGAGIATLGFQIAGYSKLKKAGDRFNIGATSSGIGLTFNLNK